MATTAVVIASVWVGLHGRGDHAGQHFVAGQADARDVRVTLGPRQHAYDHWLASRTCLYDPERHVVMVPVRLQAAPRGSVTLHVTASVSTRQDGSGPATDIGDDDVVASATQDFAMDLLGELTSVRIPLDRAAWASGARRCTVDRWTMTPGAWYPNDD